MVDWGFSGVGLLVGFAVGATGVGGGSLMTPLLILVYGVAPTVAVGTDLVFATLSKSFAASLLGRRQAVDWPLVGWLAAGSVPASVTSLWAVHTWLPPASQSALIQSVLSVAIVLTAAFMLVQGPVMRRLNGHGRGWHWSPRQQRACTVAVGAVIGVLVSLSSVGAGAIGLALLMFLYPRHDVVRLIGSDLVHAVLVTAIAGAGHLATHSVDGSMLVALLLGAVPGIWLGTRVALRLRDGALRHSIAAVLLIVGVTTLAHAATR
ncbi:MAG TPA: sulfite exporter TauE/SafE family protein [Nevskiaceae bacterium]|nr:sulfite exporter TauE/SafE family protein [Nevskiaceae bacterium]